MLKTIRYPLIALIIVLLSACGFHLRGSKALGQAPKELRTLYLESSSPYDAFSKDLRASLKASGTNVVNDVRQSPLILKIINVNFSQTNTLAALTNNRTANRLFTYQVQYQLLSQQGEPITDVQKIYNQQNQTVSSNQYSGSASVFNNIEQQMRSDAIYQLVISITAPASVKAIQHYQAQHAHSVKSAK